MKRMADVAVIKEWDYVENKLNFSDVVVVSDKIQWKESSVVSVDEHEGIVVLKESASNGADSEPAICYFKIVAPEGDNVTWQASLIGDSDAFEFVEAKKGIRSDGGDAIRNGHLRQRRASVKRRNANGGDGVAA